MDNEKLRNLANSAREDQILANASHLMARNLRAHYLAFVEQGFALDQAMDLTTTLMQEIVAIASQNSNNTPSDEEED